MRQGVSLVEIDKLRAHEEVSPQRLVEVCESIKKLGLVINPVIVDKKTSIILDGHHRVESLKRLGCRLVPAMEVDYMSGRVRVMERRKELKGQDIKKLVIDVVEKGKMMKQKSTKHLVKGRILGVKIKLEELK